MSYLLTLRNTCDALISSGEYNDVKLVAVLNWKTIPESSKEVKSTVIGNTRITEYVNGSTRILHVHPYGIFQIL
jgi:hypothetical protein